MNVDFVRYCDFLARMIEKYGPEIRVENIYRLVLSDMAEWKKKRDVRKIESFGIWNACMCNEERQRRKIC